MKFNLMLGVKRAIRITGRPAERVCYDAGREHAWISSMLYRDNHTMKTIAAVADAFEIRLDHFLMLCMEHENYD